MDNTEIRVLTFDQMGKNSLGDWWALVKSADGTLYTIKLKSRTQEKATEEAAKCNDGTCTLVAICEYLHPFYASIGPRDAFVQRCADRILEFASQELQIPYAVQKKVKVTKKEIQGGFGTDLERRMDEDWKRYYTQYKVYLSHRGWGDYGMLKWIGDITQDEDAIVRQIEQMDWSDADRGYDATEVRDKIRETKRKYEVENKEHEKEVMHLRRTIKKAQKSGTRQECGRWMTDRCHNSHLHNEGCSFDVAVLYINPDGTHEVEYNCCF